ncbi:MAG: archaeosine biosynthesis radical SAM protein RaSEA [Euryarchaeota archaeon]|nr:archaeosine biosynthesis radical SAM protein RaSEA [Euryarchaeota archaeon]
MVNQALNEVVQKIRKAGLAKFKGRSGATFWKEKDFLGKEVNAGVVILPTLGCRWGRSSGCTMCGYVYDSYGSSQEEILHNFKAALKSLDGIEYLKIFNSGSFFDSAEITQDTARKIFSAINAQSEITQVQAESRPEFITEDALAAKDELQAILEIGIGLETTSDYIRENCINKNFTLEDFKRALKICKNSGVKVKAYLLVKPPFLSEKEAIGDAIASAIDAYKLGVDRISFNPVNVQRATLVEYLWKRGEYNPPWLWSVVEILESVKKKVKVPVLSHPTAVGKRRGAHNCGECDSKVYSGIINFSATQQSKYLKNLSCECKEKWEAQVELEQFEH